MTDQQWLEQNKEQRTPVEVWSRVMGYHRPIQFWNPGKQSEHAERLPYQESLLTR